MLPKMSRQILSLLLSIAMLLSAIPVLADEPGGGVFADDALVSEEEFGGETDEDVFSDIYVIPIDRKAATSWNSSVDNAMDTNHPGLSLCAIAKKYTSKPGYQVTLHVEYLRFWDAIQVLRPETIEQAKAVFTGSATIRPRDSSISSQGFLNPANKVKYINDENYGVYDHLYLSDEEITFEDGSESLSDGYITFDIPNLTDRIFVKRLSRHGLNAETGTYARNFTFTYGYDFRFSEKIRLDESFINPQSGEYTWGYEWVNYYTTTGIATTLSGRRSDPSGGDYGRMKAMIKNDVTIDVSEQGAISATFILNRDFPKPDTNDDYPIYTAAVAESRAALTDDIAKAMGSDDTYETNYTLLHNSPDEGKKTNNDGSNVTFTLTYDDWRQMVFGRGFYLFAGKSNFSRTTDTYYRAYLALRPEAANDDELVLDSGKGVKLITKAGNVAEGVVFSGDNTVEGSLYAQDNQKLLDLYKNTYGILDDKFIIYTISYLDANGNITAPQRAVDIELAIPDNIDPGKLKVLPYKTGVQRTVNPFFYGSVVDAAAKTVTIPNVINPDYLTASYLLCEEPAISDTSLLSEGIYEVTVAGILAGAGAEWLNLSMSSAAFARNKHILAVNADGTRDLYLSLAPPPPIETTFISDLFYYDKNTNERKRTDYLSYYLKDSGEIDYFWDFIVAKIVKIPLSEANTKNMSKDIAVNMIVPVMDAFSGIPGSGWNNKDAQLRITSVKPYEGELPWEYDHSLLLGQIKKAERAYDKVPSTAFEQAITAAKAVYSTSLTAEQSVSEVNKLLKAELTARIAKVENLGSSYFTSGAYSTFLAEQIKAENLIANANASNTDLVAEVEALRGAIEQLTFKKLTPGIYKGTGDGPANAGASTNAADFAINVYVQTTATGITRVWLGANNELPGYLADCEGLYAQIVSAYPAKAQRINSAIGTSLGILEAVQEALYASASGVSVPDASEETNVSAINTNNESPAAGILATEAVINTYGAETYADIRFSGNAVTDVVTYADSTKNIVYAAVKSEADAGGVSYTLRIPNAAQPTYATVAVGGEEKFVRLAFGEANLDADKSALESLYNSVKNLVTEDFTGETWPAFAAALADAVDLLEGEAAQQAVDNARAALQNAYNALAKAPFDINRNAEYTVNATAWHYDLNQLSMMDAYIDNPVGLRVKDGVITLILKMKPYNGGDSVTRFWPGVTSESQPASGGLAGALDPETKIRTAEFTIPSVTEDYRMGVYVVPMEGFEYQRVKLRLDMTTLLTAPPTEPVPEESADKTGLAAKLAVADAIEADDYTDDSYAALTTAIADAEALLGDTEATQDAVDAALAALNSAITALEAKSEEPPAQTVDTLAEKLAEAAAIEADGYIAGSHAALTAAVAAAETALAGGELSPEQIETQIAALEAAAAALIEETALQARPAEGEPVEGTYSLADRTTLKQFASNNDSMGNRAIDHSQSYLEIDENGARVHLFFNPLRVPLGGSEFEGYLL
ncbi:MAG: NEAT domain-containing protein, partial [Gracilibacteraceae bacterium]|nr:NEAT domain-containing protein [Gracilibacteraceae bacterium]